MANQRAATRSEVGASAPAAGGGATTVATGQPMALARRGRRRGTRRRMRVIQLLFLLPAVVYMLLFFGYPVVKNFVMGFQEYTSKTFFTGEAPWVRFDNYS